MHNLTTAQRQQVLALIASFGMDEPVKETEVVTAKVVTEPAKPTKAARKASNSEIADAMRAHGLYAGGDAWYAVKDLVAAGAPLDGAIVTVKEAMPEARTHTVRQPKAKPAKAKKATAKKAAKPAKAKKVYPAIACDDCGTVVPTPKWNQRYCSPCSKAHSEAFREARAEYVALKTAMAAAK